MPTIKVMMSAFLSVWITFVKHLARLPKENIKNECLTYEYYSEWLNDQSRSNSVLPFDKDHNEPFVK